MNIKHKLSILAASVLLIACTSENELVNPVGPDEGTADDTNRREVLLSFKNKLNLKSEKTKADAPIATAEENYIQSLDIYVFGSKDETTGYTFQELFYFRDDASTVAGDWAHSFNLTTTDKDNITTALLKLQKGLFVKLYCVVNKTELYTTTADGTVKYTDFQPLQQSNPGQAGNNVTAGKPTEAEFLELHSQLIDPAADTKNDILQTPLPMAGSYTTPIDLTDFSVSARTQLSFKLSRMVARFDIINDAALSKFTIESISMANGQDGSTFFPIKTLGNDLITYPERPVSGDTQTEAVSQTVGAFYSWPSPKEDHGYLILKGKYAVNKTEMQDVTYQVPLQQTANGEEIGNYIEVAYNHRYTIAITKADTYHLDFTLNVADWDDQENIDEYNPNDNNDLDKNTPVTLITDADASKGAYVLPNGNISLLPATDSKIAFEMGSNSALTEQIVYKDGSAQWLVMDETAAPRTKATSMTTKYAYKIDETTLNGGSPLLPVTIQLTNPASGNRKEIIVIATQGPEISLATDQADGTFNTYDPATKTATIYNVAAQSIKFDVLMEERETTGYTVTPGSWLTATGTDDAAEGDCTLTLSSKQSDNSSATVTFTSKATTSTSTAITVKVVKADIAALTEDDFASTNGTNTFVPASVGNAKVTMTEATATSSFTLTVSSPEGISIKSKADWLSVSQSDSVIKGIHKTTLKVSISNGQDLSQALSGTIVLGNLIAGANDLTIDVATTVPAP